MLQHLWQVVLSTLASVHHVVVQPLLSLVHLLLTKGLGIKKERIKK